MGRIQGNTIALSSDTDIHQGGRITATDAIQLKAKNDITMDNTVQHLANQDVLDRTAGIAVSGNQGVGHPGCRPQCEPGGSHPPGPG
jgi:hypothetical protein